MGGDMAGAVWPLLLLGIVSGCQGHGTLGWQETPSMTYPAQNIPEDAGLDPALSSVTYENDPAAWEKRRFLALAHLPPLFNMFGVGVPRQTGSRNLRGYLEPVRIG